MSHFFNVISMLVSTHLLPPRRRINDENLGSLVKPLRELTKACLLIPFERLRIVTGAMPRPSEMALSISEADVILLKLDFIPCIRAVA
jgi:hypothetical protein